MLNRKLSEYLFYGSLALITIIILLINMVVMGNIKEDMETTNQSNIALAAEIEALNEIVQDNKGVQTSHLYGLYNQVPGVYSGQELTFKTFAILEQVGIQQDPDVKRGVEINESILFPQDSALYDLSIDYKLVEVNVSFKSNDITQVYDLIDALYETTQIFIIKGVQYTVPEENSEDLLSMQVSFIAIYRTQETTEE